MSTVIQILIVIVLSPFIVSVGILYGSLIKIFYDEAVENKSIFAGAACTALALLPIVPIVLYLGNNSYH